MLVVAAAIVALTVVVAANPAFAYVDSAPRPIKAYSSGKCVDLRKQDNWSIQLYSCHGGSNQQWVHRFFAPGSDPAHPEQHFFIFKTHAANGYCIAADSNPSHDFVFAASGVACIQSHAMWEVVHEFVQDRTYSVLRNIGSGRCLALFNNSSANTTRILQEPCVLDSPSQAWALGPTPR
ncbi:RICIN domain-containing protein [Catellatospora methionotrophica]|uniref:RICIN domain-containing protein n=1 Tax=Catellatospora methionotrophica TaxID=121620 RepID=UPI0033DD1FD3